MTTPPAPPPSAGDLADGSAPLEVLRHNLAQVYDRIERARRASPRAAAAVTLVAVTKAAPPGCFDLLRALGERDVGENRVADAASKREAAPPGLVWHGIGHLQSNKAKKAVRTFDVFHALDSVRLAEALDALLTEAGRRWPVYAQVNAARDPAKGGVAPEDAGAFLETLARFPSLEVVGLMTMAKEDDPGERARSCFRTLREVRDDALRRGTGRVPPRGLSMGMSDDFEVAVEEGATVVRVGRAVWAGVGPDSPATPGARPRTLDRPRT
ncbi:MAG: YggS family pyridoxal phosphate-dependent enzyme [Planctomycetes bacterium]|nr:YggS family pyridoxal phosphate-dependent enzyme [Planctomycetota bacterium]